MIAHIVAVIGGEDDDRILGEAERRELIEHAADAVIDEADQPVIERDRLAHLALGRGKEHRRRLHRAAVVALLMQPFHMRRQVIGRRGEGRRQLDLFRLVHAPILARRREGVMRIGERAHEEERRIALRIVLEPRHRALGAIAGRMQRRRQLRAPGLMHARQFIFRRRQRILFADQAFDVVCLGIGPTAVMALQIVAMLDREIDRLEAVERIIEIEIRIGLPRPAPIPDRSGRRDRRAPRSAADPSDRAAIAADCRSCSGSGPCRPCRCDSRRGASHR